MDKLTALQVFRSIVESGSFAAAGRRLRLSPAAVSKNISELETELQARLLHRSTRRMSLTEAGRIYYEQISRVLDDMAQADQSIGPLQSQPSGQLRVMAPLTWSVICMQDMVPRFLAQYPQISMELDLSDRREDFLAEGFDLAIRGSDRLEDSSLIARPLSTLTHVVCGVPGYFQRCGIPHHPQELRTHNCVQYTLSDHVDTWAFEQMGVHCSVPVSGRLRVSSSLMVKSALLSGFGLSLVPLPYVQGELASGQLQQVLPDWKAVVTQVYAIYASRKHMPSKVRVFLEFLQAEFAAQAVLRPAPVG